MKSVSIVTCTARAQPMLQWLADSICNQSFTDVALEWVVVDALLWGPDADVRCQELKDVVAGRLDVTHVPPKPTRWQGPSRYTKSDYYALCNARNTGIIVSQGDRIILADDCMVLDPHWLKGHCMFGDRGVCGTFCTYRTATVVNGKIIAADPGPYGWDSRRDSHPRARRTNGGWAFGLNCSFPREAIMHVNGYDEEYDSAGGGEDCDAGIRMERAGWEFWWAPECAIYQILQTHAPVYGHAGWGKKDSRPQKELRVRRDGQMHFAHEVLTERLILDDMTRSEPLGNLFSLQELHSAYQATGKIPEHDLGPDYDWVDGQPLAEME